ncbi:MAG: histidine kinase [Acidobacteria bacterium]|nr:histidine kinase [Acidobacteriota bacterium]
MRARPWRRICVALGLALLAGLLLRPVWTSGLHKLLMRTSVLALTGVLVFGLFEQWPRRLPAWLRRWVLQVVSVGIAMPLTTLVIYTLTTRPGGEPFWLDRERMNGFMLLTFFGVLIAPWTALAALLQQREAFARHQALAFELERSQLERQALDARLQLLQGQVAPHFLFNTLANVQALVDAGSPRAADVLRSLVAYLRAAVPRLDAPVSTLGREIQLATAYLELMQMRMPDRLTFALRDNDAASDLRCPPLTLLTLVENAVRHGIDPSEDGGRIDVDVELQAGRCLVRVCDTGLGFQAQETSKGPGTGLATLRERLELAYGGRATLRISSLEPHGVRAELDLPANEEGRR